MLLKEQFLIVTEPGEAHMAREECESEGARGGWSAFTFPLILVTIIIDIIITIITITMITID